MDTKTARKTLAELNAAQDTHMETTTRTNDRIHNPYWPYETREETPSHRLGTALAHIEWLLAHPTDTMSWHAEHRAEIRAFLEKESK